MFYAGIDSPELGSVALRSPDSEDGVTVLDASVPKGSNYSLFFIESELLVQTSWTNVSRVSHSFRVRPSCPSTDDVDPVSLPVRYWGHPFPSRSAWQVKDTMIRSIIAEADKKIDPELGKKGIFPPAVELFQLSNRIAPNSNVVVLQKILKAPFVVDVVVVRETGGKKVEVEEGKLFKALSMTLEKS